MNLSRVFCCLFIISTLFFFSSVSVQADTFTVTNIVDDVNTVNTLRWAVAAANTAGGTTTHTINFNIDSPVTIFSLDTPLLVTAKMSLVGEGVNKTIIDGKNASNYLTQCFRVSGSLNCRNLTIQNGYSPPAAGELDGGAVKLTGNSARVSLQGCRVRNCDSIKNGGAFFVDYGATLSLSGCDIFGNTAGIMGGAIYNQGAVNIHDCTFSDNSVIHNQVTGADGHAGGAIYNFSHNATIDISFSTFEENFSAVMGDSVGGAIYNANANSNALNIRYSTFKNNYSVNGGAIYNRGWCNIDKSTFSGNLASVDHIHNPTGTETANGGALFLGRYGHVIALNTTFSGNQAKSRGGAIYDGALSGAEINLSFVTITANQAGDGGGIKQQHAEISCINTLIAGNLDTSSGPFPILKPDFSGTMTSAGYNIVGVSPTIVGDTTGNRTGTLAAPLDPRLGPLQQDNGEPTHTHALLLDSPAIDGGCSVDLFGNMITVDQREYARPLRGQNNLPTANDIGAYETNLINCYIATVAVYTVGSSVELFSESNVGRALDEIASKPGSYPSGTYVLKCREGYADHDLHVDMPGYNFILSGGYSCDRSERLGNSYIRVLGLPLTISSGTIVVDGIIIQG